MVELNRAVAIGLAEGPRPGSPRSMRSTPRPCVGIITCPRATLRRLGLGGGGASQVALDLADMRREALPRRAAMSQRVQTLTVPRARSLGSWMRWPRRPQPPARTRRWTRVEYERLVELGVFEPGERLELIDGLLVVREPQGSRHAAAIRRVLAALHRTLGDAWQIDSQLPIALDDASEPSPTSPWSRAIRAPTATRTRHVPCWSSRSPRVSYRIDREYKVSLYARAGIAEYWIVDLLHEAIEIHREPQASPAALYGWLYRSVETLRPPETVAPLVALDRAIPVADLCPDLIHARGWRAPPSPRHCG